MFEKQLDTTSAVLRAIPVQKQCEMRKEALRVYRQHFATFAGGKRRLYHAAFITFAARLLYQTSFVAFASRLL
jgi:hypothetical protein